jgi:hypothetical protein
MIRVGRERYSVLIPRFPQLGERLADRPGTHLLRVIGIFWMAAYCPTPLAQDGDTEAQDTKDAQRFPSE